MEDELLDSLKQFLPNLNNPVVVTGPLLGNTQTVKLRTQLKNGEDVTNIKMGDIYAELEAAVRRNQQNGNDKIISVYKFQMTPVIYDPISFDAMKGIMVRYAFIDRPPKEEEEEVKPKVSKMHLLDRY